MKHLILLLLTLFIYICHGKTDIPDSLIIDFIKLSLKEQLFSQVDSKVFIVVDDTSIINEIYSDMTEEEHFLDIPFSKNTIETSRIRDSEFLIVICADTSKFLNKALPYGNDSVMNIGTLLALHYDCIVASHIIVKSANEYDINALTIPIFVDNRFTQVVNDALDIPYTIISSVLILLGYNDITNSGILREGCKRNRFPDCVRWNNWHTYHY